MGGVEYNEQPWRFLVGKKGDETYAKILDSLVEFNQAWAKTAPVLMLSAGEKTFTANESPIRTGCMIRVLRRRR